MIGFPIFAPTLRRKMVHTVGCNGGYRSSPVRLDYIFGAISPAEGGRRAIPPGATTFREATDPNRSPAHGEERGQQSWVLEKSLPSLSRRQYATI